MRPILGVDIEELARFQSPTDALVHRILSDAELTVYRAFQSDARKAEYLAGRFAGKEAYKKAYQTFQSHVQFKDVSILNRDDGSPYIVSSYRPDDALLISLSHSDHYVVVVVTGETT